MANLKARGNIANSIDYSGVVTLSQKLGENTFKIASIKNAGGKALFNFLADCLAGDFDIAKIDRPSKIMLLYQDSDGKMLKPDNAGFIYITTKPERVYSSENESIVKYSFTISQDLLAGMNFNAIGLYGRAESDVEKYAAYCLLKEEDLNGISVSSVLLVDWELHLSN